MAMESNSIRILQGALLFGFIPRQIKKPSNPYLKSDDEVRDGVEEARRRLHGHGGADH
jgi:hypothetical protein